MKNGGVPVLRIIGGKRVANECSPSPVTRDYRHVPQSPAFVAIRNISVPWTDIEGGHMCSTYPMPGQVRCGGFLRVDPLFDSGDPRS